jgi:iron(III) transport system permease protein
VFFGVSNALRKGRGVLENAAKLSGGSAFTVFRTISLPLVLPSLLSTGLLVFSRTMANFGIAAQLALPFGGEVLTTRIYKAISELDIQSLSVLSILLIAISYTLYTVAERWMRRRAFYADESARSCDPELASFGRKAWVANTSVIVFFSVVLVVPLITLLLSSFMKRWGLSINAGNMTVNNYALVLFQDPMMKRSFLNSLVFGTVSAGAAVCIAVAIVYLYRFARSKVSAVLLSMASLPLSVPNIILAVAAIFAWINPPLKLYGTRWIIMLTYTVLFIPICIRQITGLAENVSPSIDRSARTLGIPALRRITRLFLPQVLRGAAAGFIISFLIAFREIPISLLLYSTGNETAGVLLFTIQSNAYGLEMTSTVAVIVIAVSIAGNLLVNKLCEKRLIHENDAVE